MSSPFQISETAMNEFFSECEELTQRLAQNFILIEKGNDAHSTVDAIYRDIHSLKGSSQLFGFKQLGELAHTMESSLDPVRKKEIPFSSKLMNTLFKCMDIIDRMVSSIQKKQEMDFQGEIDLLIPLLSTAPRPTSAHETEEVALTPVAPEPLKAAETPKAAPASSAAPTETDKDSPSTIRVPVALLDRLMTIMGEMVLVRNQVLQYSSRSDDLEFLNLSQRLNVVTSEIQTELMKTRMQPIGNVINKFSRVVRDLAKDLSKKIELQLIGAETELDKTLLEAVKDPLTHIIRNSCDHGIEMPDERRKSGKPETGTIYVRSYHESGQVIIEVKDDGKGLHRDKIMNKAIEKGLVTQEKAAALSEREIFNFIFAPGFSTAAKVTNVSGRGVGMDVVRSNIERIGGVVELSSDSGKGMQIRLKIPLTLAIVPAMIVRCDNDRYAIPQVKLVELVRVDKSGVENKIEYLQGKPVYRLRGNILPLIDLKGVLKFPNYQDQLMESDAINIVVLNAERQFFGLVVDEILDTADIVVKPLNRFLKFLSIYSGATVLGDGSVAIILDVLGIAETLNLVSERTNSDAVESSSNLSGLNKGEDSQEFLLFRLNSPTKHAILLTYVHRLEEFKRSSIEFSGSQRVVRYRNSVLPIISINQFLNLNEKNEAKENEVISVIVTQRGDSLYGFEVNEILDVQSEAMLELGVSDRPGILGNLITPEEIIVVVDPQRILMDVSKRINHANHGSTRSTDPIDMTRELAQATEKSLHELNSSRSLKILYAEDMAFFRKQVCLVLQNAGHSVIAAKDGREAMTILESSERSTFDVILSDIEMPNLNGLDFAIAVRLHTKWKNIPLIALTTRCERQSIEKGLQAGFNLYLEKLNPHELLAALEKVASETRKPL